MPVGDAFEFEKVMWGGHGFRRGVGVGKTEKLRQVSRCRVFIVCVWWGGVGADAAIMQVNILSWWGGGWLDT